MESKEKRAADRKEIEQTVTDGITVEENEDICEKQYRDACATYHTYLEEYCDPLQHATLRHTC